MAQVGEGPTSFGSTGDSGEMRGADGGGSKGDDFEKEGVNDTTQHH